MANVSNVCTKRLLIHYCNPFVILELSTLFNFIFLITIIAMIVILIQKDFVFNWLSRITSK